MSASYAGGSMNFSKQHIPFARRAGAWLGMAATPTFAVMAMLTHSLGGDQMAVVCGTEPSSFAGMAPMYLLMTVFHSTPWLRLINNRSSHENGRPTA